MSSSPGVVTLKLCDLVDNSRTDKNTSHSYLDTYDMLFSSRKDTAKHVLEIGIQQGGSIKMWREYFTNATVYGLDIMSPNSVWDEIGNDPKIVLYTSTDAYNLDFFRDTFLNPGLRFDVLIDDGPHTLDSMKEFIVKYSQVLAEGGVLVVEDVHDMSWIEHLTNVVPENLKPYIQVFDLRSNKGRWDDIMFVIDTKKV